MTTLSYVELAKIEPNPFQVRLRFDIQELKESVTSVGLQQPIKVRPKPNQIGKFQIVFGHRRFECAKALNWVRIQAEVVEVSDEDMLKLSIIENLQREDLTDYEKAKLFQVYHEKFGKTYEEIAQIIGKKDRSYVAHHIAMVTKLATPIQEMLSRDNIFREKLTEGHTRAIVSIPEPGRQKELAEKVVSEGLSVRETEAEVKKLLETTASPLVVHEFIANIYNVWNFACCEPRFGKESYPGRIPGQIVQNLLYYYVNSEEALIVDPMAGSGTTKDVVEWWNKTFNARLKVLCYDISPVRDDIKQHDIRLGFPSEAQDCDLIFLDPPYWRLQKGKYAKESVSEFETYEKWLSFMECLAKSCFNTVKKGGYVALLVMAFLDNYPDKYPIVKAVAEVLGKPHDVVLFWTYKSRRLSPFVRESLVQTRIGERQAQYLMKYGHETQDKLARKVVEAQLNVRETVELLRLYDNNPQESLDEMVKQVKGIKTEVVIPLEKLPEPLRGEVEKVVEEGREKTSNCNSEKNVKP